MNSINPYATTIFQQPDFCANSNVYNELMFTRIATSNQQHKDITLVTEEGDRVTISSSVQHQTVYSTYEGMSQYTAFATSENPGMEKNDLAWFEGEQFEYENDSNLTISVDGDLNKQELKSIRKVVKTIDKIMTDILYGKHIPDGLAKALEINNLSSITSLEANYQYEETVLVEQTAIQEAVTYSQDGLAEPVEPPTDTELPIENAIDEMITSVKDSGVKPSKFIKPVTQLFANMLNHLPDGNHQNNPKAHLVKQIGTDLIERINQMPENEDTNTYPVI